MGVVVFPESNSYGNLVCLGEKHVDSTWTKYVIHNMAKSHIHQSVIYNKLYRKLEHFDTKKLALKLCLSYMKYMQKE